MNELIQRLTSNLGIDEGMARSATSGLMQFIQGQVGEQEFAGLADKLPGMDEVMSEGAEAKKAGGGLLGNLAGMASSLGGSLGGAAGLTSVLASSGLDAGQAGSFVQTVIEFVKEKAGADVVSGLMTKIPELKKLIG